MQVLNKSVSEFFIKFLGLLLGLLYYDINRYQSVQTYRPPTHSINNYTQHDAQSCYHYWMAELYLHDGSYIAIYELELALIVDRLLR